MMTPPEFWRDDGWPARVLAPLAAVSRMITARRVARAPAFIAPVPVLCVGNVTLGGSGKTPVVRDLVARLAALGRRPMILSRGYGGRARGPLRVDPAIHDAGAVGDEPLLLAGDAPVFIGADRTHTARLALAAGAGCLVLDDGFQNPGLGKTASLLVFDGPAGIGNGRVFPAGPLREPLAAGLARAAGLVILGDDGQNLAARAGPRPVWRGRLVPEAGAAAGLAGRRVLAFAGIGRPEKFFQTLRACGAEIAATQIFADHHPYSAGDLAALAAAASRLDAALVTTEKDRVRLPAARAATILCLPVTIAWDDAAAVTRFLTEFLEQPCPAPGGAAI